MRTKSKTVKFEAQEVAYRIPGGEWKRKIIKTEAAMIRFLDWADDQCAEARFRKAER